MFEGSLSLGDLLVGFPMIVLVFYGIYRWKWAAVRKAARILAEEQERARRQQRVG